MFVFFFFFCSIHEGQNNRLKWHFKTNSSLLFKAVLIHFTLPGNVYIPEHDLFSDIPVRWKHQGCLVYTEGKKTAFRCYLHPAHENTG